MAGKFLVPQNTPQEVKKGPREEVLEQLKLKKTQLKQLNQPNTRGGKMVRRALGKERETCDGKDVVTPDIGFFCPVSQEEDEDYANEMDVTDDNTEPKIKIMGLKEMRAKSVTKKIKITNIHKKSFK